MLPSFSVSVLPFTYGISDKRRWGGFYVRVLLAPKLGVHALVAFVIGLALPFRSTSITRDLASRGLFVAEATRAQPLPPDHQAPRL